MGRVLCSDATWAGRSDCRHCAVRSLMVFSALPEDAFTSVLGGIQHSMHPSQSVLYEQGQPGKFILSIRHGWVKLIHADANGVTRIVRLMGAGSLLGLELFSLRQQEYYLQSAVSYGEVDLCRIPLSTMRRLSEEYPELYPGILRRSQEHVNAADEVIASFSTGALRQRIGHVLSFLSREMSQQGGFSLMSVAEVAALVGACEESVSRILADLKRQGHLVRRGALFEFFPEHTHS